MKNRLLAALLAFGMTNTVFAQLDSEDLPPPEPVPMTEPIPVAESELNAYAEPVQMQEGGEKTAYDFGVSYAPHASGWLVRGVIVGSPAQAAGVQPNDTIVSVNGTPVGGVDLNAMQVTSVGVLRGGQTRNLSVGAAPQATTTQRATYAAPSTAAAPPTSYAAPATAYAVPTTTYSAPRSYRYTPNSYRTTPNYAYRSVTPYYNRGYSSYYRSYRRPSVSIGVGVGPGRGFYGPGFGRYGGFGPGFGPGIGYGRGFGPGFGPGFYGRGRSGVGISVGGIGIRF